MSRQKHTRINFLSFFNVGYCWFVKKVKRCWVSLVVTTHTHSHFVYLHYCSWESLLERFEPVCLRAVTIKTQYFFIQHSLLFIKWSAHSQRLCVFVAPQVEEVKKHSHCLAFSSAGPQSQTYYVSFDSFTEHLRWHRHAAKVTTTSTRKKTNSSIFVLLCFLLFFRTFFSSNSYLLHLIRNTGYTHMERWQLFCIQAFSLHASACFLCVDRSNNGAHQLTLVLNWWSLSLASFCQFFWLFLSCK